jgi:small GTP-binding protein
MTPKFAVVGHPNKGKSTIVAALAMDDSVAISQVPGTTTKAKEYPLTIDGKLVYTLIDTPGFQRPRAVLAYLKSKNAPAHKRLDVLKSFIREYENNPKFNDDIELLKPITDGAGIIYIVDASKPYSVEFELDMQILSYAGAPSMAILNFITDSDYSKEWKEALKHYFKLIKRFNPMQADIKEYIDLLEAFGHLNEEWQDSIKEAVEAFKKLHKDRINKSALVITDLVFNSLSHTKKMAIKDDSSEVREQLEKAFYNDIVMFEKSSFSKIKAIWDHKRVEVKQDEFSFDSVELFSKESEEYFGLSEKEAITYSATVGAAIGGGIDLAFLGHTLFAGAAIGGIVGAIGGYLGFGKLAEIKILGHKLGGKELIIGPIKNINFGFILLNRALLFTKVIATLSHAKRDDISIKEYKDILNDKEKKEFFKLHKKIIDKKTKELKEQYSKKVAQIIEKMV